MPDKVTFQRKDLKGSRLRCFMLSSLPDKAVAEFLTSVVQPHASVQVTDTWMPRGFLDPAEPRLDLDESPGFLNAGHQEILTQWWLAVRQGANTPNWDLLSTCSIGDSPGLLLIEAKAHEGELNVETDNCDSENPLNQVRIHRAIREANEDLNASPDTMFSGWSLSDKKCYQLSNRFAFAWKLATLRVPVVLVYLGFLNAAEMNSCGRRILTSYKQWHDCVLARTRRFIREAVWNRRIEIKGTPFIIRICAADVNVRTSVAGSSIVDE